MTAPSARYDLTGRTALVTGAGGLLGRQHVAALVDAGARVVVSDIGLAQADATIAAVKEIATRRRSCRRRHRRDVAGIGWRGRRGSRRARHHRRHPRQQRRDRSQGHLDAGRHAFVALRSLSGSAMADGNRGGTDRRDAVLAGVWRRHGPARPRRDPQHRLRSRRDRAGPAALPATQHRQRMKSSRSNP